MNGWQRIRFLGDCLRLDADEAADERLWAEIAAGRPDWPWLLALADRQRLAPALWVALRERGLMEPAPEAIRLFLDSRGGGAGGLARPVPVYLEDQYRANRRRNLALRRQTIELVQALNRRGIEPVLLKGAAFLFVPPLCDPAIRVMRDLDLLLERAAMPAAVAALGGIGYAEVDMGMPPGHHHPPLYRDGDPASVELHWDLLAPQARRALPTEAALAAAVPCAIEGGAARILAPTERLLHLLLHAQLVDRGHRRRTLRLAEIYEFALLSRAFGNAIDWERVAGGLRRQGGEAALQAYCLLAHRLLGAAWPLPMEAPSAARRHLFYCRLRVMLPEPLQRLDSLLDQLAVGFSRAMVEERYGPAGGAWGLWRARWHHLRVLRRKYRGKLRERLSGPPRRLPSRPP